MNTCTTLQAILMLERSDNGNTIREMPFAEAFPKLLQQVFLPTSPEAKQKTLQLMKELAAQVRIYHFHSEPTKEAVRKAWETIN